MKNTFGNNLSLTLFGESHGPFIGAVLDGLAPGIDIDEDFIKHQLTLRRPAGRISTARVEADEYTFASGVFNGKTTGTPLCILIPNTSQKSKDYGVDSERFARPGHADVTGFIKFHGFEDYRGGGHFSGRITAALVAAGGILIPALKKKGILIGTHIKSLGGIKDRDFDDYSLDIEALSKETFAVLDKEAGARMQEYATKIAEEGDSVGGVLETAILGVPAGVGEPWFDTVEGLLSHALFSIPAIKGVQFGAGFDLADSKGSIFNDPIESKDGRFVTKTNNNGGINGGITNGMPITVRLAVKPTPSIYKEQDTVEMRSGKNVKHAIEGRHDPAIIHRARVVVDSVCALCIYDLLAGRFGTDWFGGND